MSALQAIQLRTVGWAIVPFTGLVVVPWWLRQLAHEPMPASMDAWQWVGVWLLVNGVGLAGWCVYLFNVVGQGTPLPMDPPKRFVVEGPYRVVRNPMVLGLLSIVIGEAVLFQSRVIAIYGVCLSIGAQCFVRYWEEPDLARRFGEAYRTYQHQVPRWIPHLPQRSKSSTPERSY